jgi:hypothetical protein
VAAVTFVKIEFLDEGREVDTDWAFAIALSFTPGLSIRTVQAILKHAAESLEEDVSDAAEER